LFLSTSRSLCQPEPMVASLVATETTRTSWWALVVARDVVVVSDW